MTCNFYDFVLCALFRTHSVTNQWVFFDAPSDCYDTRTRTLTCCSLCLIWAIPVAHMIPSKPVLCCNKSRCAAHAIPMHTSCNATPAKTYPNPVFATNVNHMPNKASFTTNRRQTLSMTVSQCTFSARPTTSKWICFDALSDCSSTLAFLALLALQTFAKKGSTCNIKSCITPVSNDLGRNFNHSQTSRISIQLSVKLISTPFCYMIIENLMRHLIVNIVLCKHLWGWWMMAWNKRSGACATITKNIYDNHACLLLTHM